MEAPPDRNETFRVAIREFGPFDESIRREWEAFEKQSGCGLQLEVVSMDHQPLYETLFAKGGLKSGDWDIALVNTDWLAEAHETNALLDLAPYIAKRPPDDYPEGWPPSLLRLQQFDEELLGLPYHDGPECLIYRTDMLRDETLRKVYYAKFGYELEVPETWDEFVRIAEFMNRPERRLYGTVLAAFPDGHNTVYDICLQLWTRGGELFDEQGKLRLDTPEMIDALRFYRAALNNKFVVHPKCREYDSVAAGEAFLRGEVVMMVNWFGFASVCETSAESKVRGLVAIAPVPRGPGGRSASLNCYWLASVAAGSPHRQIAYDFARLCMSKENDRQRTLGGVIGCRLSTWTDEQVAAAIPFYKQMQALHESARELPRKSNWGDLCEVIDQMALEAINTDTPIEDIVSQAQQQADKLQQ